MDASRNRSSCLESQESIVGAIKTPYGLALRVPLAHFRDHILPPLRHEFDSAQILHTLRNSGEESSRLITAQNRWRGFAQDPAHCACSEKESFTSLRHIIEAITEVASADDKSIIPTVCFQNNVKCVTDCLSRDENTFPDAYAARIDSPEPSWTSIALCCEYKKGESFDDVSENTAKVAISMSRCMRNDPRRRFVFGYTIENTNMKLWFWDRAQFLVSQSFNFVTEHEHVVQFFLSIMYAEPHELGWDSTMTPLADGHNYDITIHSDGKSMVYRTLQLISDSGAKDVHSSGTRVWKAIAVVDGKETGEPVALKDCWVNSELTPEGEICELVRADAQKSDLDGRTVALLDTTFLTVCCHGHVFLDSGRKVLDCVRSLTPQNPTAQATLDTASSGLSPDILITHYRIVFKEIGKAISQETSLSVMFRGLAHIACALKLMHAGRWVHRDVSTGNILVDLNERNGRLADLEYAKQMGQGRDDRLGTAFFMAVEVDMKQYLFIPRKEPWRLPSVEPPGTVWDLLSGEVSESQTSSTSPPTSATKPTIRVFRYNPLHDLESLWWVAVYFLYRREIVQPTGVASSRQSESASWNPEAQRAYADKIFCDQLARYIAITDADFGRNIEVLHPSIRPLASLLENVRVQLVAFYRKAEADTDSVDHRCADGLHEVFVEKFVRIANSSNARGVQLRRPRVSAGTASSQHEPSICGGENRNSTVAQSIPRRRSIDEVEGATYDSAVSPLSKKAKKLPLRPKANYPPHRYNLRPRRT